jgi:hypothetical protein
MSKFFNNIYNVYGIYYIRMWVILLLTIVSLAVLPLEYFLIAIGIYLVYMPVIQTIEHEYICHEYIVPKNKIVDFFALVLFYIHHDGNVANKRNYHVTHHRYWKDQRKDPTQEKMIGVPVWRHVLGFERPMPIHIDQVRNSLLESNQLVQLLEPHAKKIYWGYRLAMLIFLPLPWFVVFVVYVPWLFTTAINFHDTIFHGQVQGKDNSWLLPIYGNGSWHIKHHSEYARNYHGPSKIVKFNIAWYLQKLLFVDNRQPLI